uniref:glutathione transferase n=1 Tax=Papio anubis TaxID=9555 RepID=A0A8I5NDF0_PAPAN
MKSYQAIISFSFHKFSHFQNHFFHPERVGFIDISCSLFSLLSKDGSLLFQQVPMVEIDGMKLVQTRAILNYIASKYNLYGKDIKERALIDMYTEGIADLGEMILLLPFCQPEDTDANTALIKEKTKNRYFPAFEKVSESVQCLGN